MPTQFDEFTASFPGLDIAANITGDKRETRGLLHYPQIKGDMAPLWEATQRSYAGVDIIATGFIDGRLVVFDNISALSYSTHREKVNVPTLGRAYARRRTRGMRTIAGTIVWIVKDRTPLYRFMGHYKYDNRAFMHLPMSDALPPFDVTITYANEYGHISVMRIYGVDIVSEGQVHSIQDLITENIMEYQAYDMDIMMPIEAEAGELPWLMSQSGVFYRDLSALSTPASAKDSEEWQKYQKYQSAITWMSIFIDDYDKGTFSYWDTNIDPQTGAQVGVRLNPPDEISNLFSDLGYTVKGKTYPELPRILTSLREAMSDVRRRGGLFWNLEETRQGIADGTILTASPFDYTTYTTE